jgi:plastocyanin
LANLGAVLDAMGGIVVSRRAVMWAVICLSGVVVGACGGSSHSTTATSSAPAVEKNGKLAIAADPNGGLSYTVKTATATAGTISISITNTSGVLHNLAIQQGTGGPVLGSTPVATSGTASITLNLKPGTYTFFCQVTGHQAAGMYGTLTVR